MPGRISREDPSQCQLRPSASILAAHAQAAAPVEVVITDAGHIIDSHIYGRGEVVTVSKRYARQLVDHGLARYARS